MRNITRIFATVAVVALSGLATTSFGQATATAQADAHATIVTPISIVKVADMEFGNIAVGATGGTVDLPTSGSRTSTGGVTLPAVTGTVNAASFTVSGQANYAYGVTLPASITIASGANSMTIGSIISNPSTTNGVLSGTGSQTLSVGGTLTVGASQAAGSYSTAATFPVTVVYN